MHCQTVFKRHELKYLVDRERQNRMSECLLEYMRKSEHKDCTICNLYYDTPTRLLIRRSMEKPVYKEKLRVRSYGTASPDSPVFIELKKKFDRVVYKRRIPMPERDAMVFLSDNGPVTASTQVAAEIVYFLRLYEEMAPRVFLSYHRVAFEEPQVRGLRVTFDTDIRWRDDQLSLCEGPGGHPLLPDKTALMEIKTDGAVPLWLVRLLADNDVRQTSFSKYGQVHQTLMTRGGAAHA